MIRLILLALAGANFIWAIQYPDQAGPRLIAASADFGLAALLDLLNTQWHRRAA